MNYNSVILVGVVALSALLWLVHGMKKYPGARLTALYHYHYDDGKPSSSDESRDKTAVMESST